MKLHKPFGIVAVLLLACTSASHAAGSCVASVDMSKLRTAVAGHADFYGDLPSRINCAKPVGKQKLVCNNEVLRMMERFDHIGFVYGFENATKRELDHRKPHGVKALNAMLARCDSEECICGNFKEAADAPFGGLSPYAHP